MNTPARSPLLLNVSALFLSEVLNKAIAFFFFILVVRFLGAEAFGQYAGALALASALAVFTDLGINVLVTRDVSKSHTLVRTYWLQGVRFKSMASFLSLLALFFLIFSGSLESNRTTLVLVATLAVILEQGVMFMRSFFQAFERMLLISSLRTAEKTALLLGTLFVLWQGQGVYAVLCVLLGLQSVSFIVHFILFLKAFRTHLIPRTDPSVSFREFLVHALPFSLFHVFSLIYLQLDTILLSFLKTDQEVGLYNAAYQLVIVLLFVCGIFLTAVFPSLTRLYHQKNHAHFRKLSHYILALMYALGGGISLFLFLLAPDIIHLLYGTAYAASVTPLYLLSFVVLFAFFNSTTSTFLNTMDKAPLTVVMVSIGAIFNFILNVIFIPHYGMHAAAITTLATEALMAGIGLWLIHREVPLFDFLKTIPRVTLALLLTGGTVFMLRFFHFGVAVAGGIVAFFFFMILFKVIQKKDLALFHFQDSTAPH